MFARIKLYSVTKASLKESFQCFWYKIDKKSRRAILADHIKVFRIYEMIKSPDCGKILIKMIEKMRNLMHFDMIKPQKKNWKQVSLQRVLRLDKHDNLTKSLVLTVD